MSDDDFAQVQVAIRRAVDKLLHEPTVRAKKLAAESGAVSHETALQEMFGLEIDGSPVSVDANELPSVQEVIAMGSNNSNSSNSGAETSAATKFSTSTGFHQPPHQS